MPFTFSHPAIVLPFKRLTPKWLSMTGLIIGSLLPDFEYFIRMRMRSTFSHNLSSIFWFNLPLGILLAFIFHNIIRDTLIDNLPYFFKTRLYKLKNSNWNLYFKKNWYVIIYSFLIGILSHLFWDSFTHWNGYFVKKFPILKTYIFFWGEKQHLLRLLQHSSTLIGGLVILIFMIKLPQNTTVSSKISLKYWIMLVVLFLLILFGRIFTGINYKDFGNLVVNIISSSLLSLLITSIIYKHSS